MEVKKMRVERLFNLGNYEHIKIGLEADIEANDGLAEGFIELDKKINERFQAIVKERETAEKKEAESSDLFYKVLNNADVLKKLKEHNSIPF